MISKNSIRPGIIHGVYPEKLVSDFGGLESFVLSILNRLTNKIKFHPIRQKNIINQVHFYAKRIEMLDDKGIDELIKTLRGKLVLNGFKADIVAEVFALIREVALRQLGMQHYDVQLLGGWLMLNGYVAEMETGEGKTLTATLPVCTAALAGIPVHVITVNDYLVQRDAEQMKPVYNAFGLSVGVVVEGQDNITRQEAYACDITYCTNKQLAFDYLRDRLVFGKQQSKIKLQIERVNKDNNRVNSLLLRGLCFAIIDEADSVLIDEARTPLIISKEGDDLSLQKIAQEAIDISTQLENDVHFYIDNKEKLIHLTDVGRDHLRNVVEPLGGIWKGEQRSFEMISQALAARFLYVRDKNYLVKDDKVQIIDEYTGRIMADRSWEFGLHQMVEAKEGCEITAQKETLAKISYQQFFRRYLKVAGMTGTASEVSRELWFVYGLNVIPIPTNKRVRRTKLRTHAFDTTDQKWQFVIKRVKEIHDRGQPILIGTCSVDASEVLSQLLNKHELNHQVLNARQDEDEADVVKLAGKFGQITVSTNMAGRGTDIKLTADVVKKGGLHVISTEYNEARRIDRQLFGRCGRQGDDGSYEFIVSLEDDLIKNFCPSIFSRFVSFFGFLKVPAFRFFGIWMSFGWAQSSAEHLHAKQRKGLLKMDKRLKSLLAFSGIRE